MTLVTAPLLNDRSGGVTSVLRDHYREKFRSFGSTSQGVDWGSRSEDALLRYDKMLAVVRDLPAGASILDVGCGYGALADVIDERELDLIYTGIDVVEEMIDAARKRQPRKSFLCGDILAAAELGTFDYVVCNGILTQKLTTSTLDMNRHCHQLITKLFDLARCGIAVNVMSSFVNFYAPNLYYRNPAELLAWCMSQLTRHVRLDHSYPLYEFTMYLYHDSVRAPVQR